MTTNYTIEKLFKEVVINLRNNPPKYDISKIYFENRPGVIMPMGEQYLHIVGIKPEGINFSGGDKLYPKGEEEILNENEYNSLKKNIEDKARTAIELSMKE